VSFSLFRFFKEASKIQEIVQSDFQFINKHLVAAVCLYRQGYIIFLKFVLHNLSLKIIS